MAPGKKEREKKKKERNEGFGGGGCKEVSSITISINSLIVFFWNTIVKSFFLKC